MDYEVLKAFNTVNRRLAPGAGPGGTISDTDDISPLTFEERVARKFIKAKNIDAVAAQDAPAEVPPNVMSPTAKPAQVETTDK